MNGLILAIQIPITIATISPMKKCFLLQRGLKDTLKKKPKLSVESRATF